MNSTKNEFSETNWKPHLVQFIGYSTNDGLVSEVEMEPLKIHLPVNPLITVCLCRRNMEMKNHTKDNQSFTFKGQNRNKM